MLSKIHTNSPARLRRTSALRDLVRETRLHKDNLVMPLFFKDGAGSEAVTSMPGVEKMGQAALLKKIEKLEKLGLKAVLLFGSSSHKDSLGKASYDERSAFHQTIRAIKRDSGIVLITDVCLCAYTDHGHCGILKGQGSSVKGQEIDNEKTLEALAKIALSHASAGADIVAPSAMADGQVGAIRNALDENTFMDTAIMSYSVKYASSFYGPFRDIYNSSPAFGDRRNCQMDPANMREALREVVLDVEEGADIVMVKPALAYLDIISDVRSVVTVPVAAYNVSGEYSMVKAAALKGWLDEKSAALEILGSIKRAGADIIITYWAEDVCSWI